MFLLTPQAMGSSASIMQATLRAGGEEQNSTITFHCQVQTTEPLHDKTFKILKKLLISLMCGGSF